MAAHLEVAAAACLDTPQAVAVAVVVRKVAVSRKPAARPRAAAVPTVREEAAQSRRRCEERRWGAVQVAV